MTSIQFQGGEAQFSFRSMEEVDRAIKEEEKQMQLIRIRRRALRAQRNTFAPMCKLPPEILVLIFHFLTSGVYNPSLAFSQVCQYWRNSALGDPMLWRKAIFIGNPKLTAYVIERAQSLPLHIQVNCARDDRHFKTIKAIMKHRQVEWLDIQTRSEQLDSLVKLLPLSARTLRHVELRVSSSALEVLQESLKPCQYPLLRSLTLVGCMFMWDSRFLTDLTALDINLTWVPFNRHRQGQDAPPSRIVSMLRRNPRLNTLSLSSVMSSAAPGSALDPQAARASLPYLQELCLRDSITNISSFLALLKCPALSKLDVHCGLVDPTTMHSSTSDLLCNITQAVAANIDVRDLTYEIKGNNTSLTAVCTRPPGSRGASSKVEPRSLTIRLSFAVDPWWTATAQRFVDGELVQLFPLQRLQTLTIDSSEGLPRLYELCSRLPALVELSVDTHRRNGVIAELHRLAHNAAVCPFPALQKLLVKNATATCLVDIPLDPSQSNAPVTQTHLVPPRKQVSTIQVLLSYVRLREERHLPLPAILLRECDLVLQGEGNSVYEREGGDASLTLCEESDSESGGPRCVFRTSQGQLVLEDWPGRCAE